MPQAADAAETRRVLDDMLSSFDAFKQANDARLDDIEKRTTADVLLEEKVDRINRRLTHLNNALQRSNSAATEPDEMVPDEEQKAAFEDYIRSGHLPLEAKNATLASATTSSNDVAASFVPQYFERQLTDRTQASSGLARLARQQFVSHGQGLDYIRHDAEVSAKWVSETNVRPATDAPKLGGEMPMGEVYANPSVTVFSMTPILTSNNG